MKCIRVAFLCAALVLPGCAGQQPKLPDLSPGISQQQVLSLWGQPKERVMVGKTPRNNYPVEVWAYYGNPKGKKPGEEYLLIFVDGELYKWAKDDPKFVMIELAELGVISREAQQFGMAEYQRRLREAAEKADQTRRALDIIRTFQNYENTRLQIDGYNQMRILQQQQLRPVPPPPPAPERPVKQRQ